MKGIIETGSSKNSLIDANTENHLFLMVDINDLILAKHIAQFVDLKHHADFIFVFAGLMSLSAWLLVNGMSKLSRNLNISSICHTNLSSKFFHFICFAFPLFPLLIASGYCCNHISHIFLYQSISQLFVSSYKIQPLSLKLLIIPCIVNNMCFIPFARSFPSFSKSIIHSNSLSKWALHITCLISVYLKYAGQKSCTNNHL